MSQCVPSAEIEGLVGAARHATLHLARAVSTEETVYVLHSLECLNSGIDLRSCRYSLALDNGIRLEEWSHRQDQTVRVKVVGAFHETRLRPFFYRAAPLTVEGLL